MEENIIVYDLFFSCFKAKDKLFQSFKKTSEKFLKEKLVFAKNSSR